MAPRFFTKALKVPLSYLRETHDIQVTGYLDDSLYVNTDPEKLVEEVGIAAELFQNLGFTISVKKSVIKPTQCIEYLGFILDSRDMTVTLPAEKTERLLAMTKLLRRLSKPSIRFVAQVEGSLSATRYATKFAMLYTKMMEIDKIEALRNSRD